MKKLMSDELAETLLRAINHNEVLAVTFSQELGHIKEHISYDNPAYKTAVAAGMAYLIEKEQRHKVIDLIVNHGERRLVEIEWTSSLHASYVGLSVGNYLENGFDSELHLNVILNAMTSGTYIPHYEASTNFQRNFRHITDLYRTFDKDPNEIAELANSPHDFGRLCHTQEEFIEYYQKYKNHQAKRNEATKSIQSMLNNNRSEKN
ncbi:MAG: hypothetical protein LBL34_01100 [Clostridiales bacterium]|jgi:hypothetical protein|nr:hypothetical protein [Clostridiales bacterium]